MIKRFTYFIVAIIFFAGLFWLLSQSPQFPQSTIETISQNSDDIYKDYPLYENPDLIFYWGDGCPHCENVKKWLIENNSDNKLKINYKEVYSNKDNKTEFYEIAKQYCPDIIDNNNIGVPTGFDPVYQKCIQGDTPIIDFLSDKLTK